MKSSDECWKTLEMTKEDGIWDKIVELSKTELDSKIYHRFWIFDSWKWLTTGLPRHDHPLYLTGKVRLHQRSSQEAYSNSRGVAHVGKFVERTPYEAQQPSRKKWSGQIKPKWKVLAEATLCPVLTQSCQRNMVVGASCSAACNRTAGHSWREDELG